MVHMTKFKALLVTIVALAALAGFGSVPVAHADVLPALPAPVLTCDSLAIHLGETLHCVVSGTAGYTPSVKITYRNPRTLSTINVWNGQGQSFVVDYLPSLGEVGRFEVLSATVYVPAYPGAHITKPYAGSIGFSVLAPVAV